MLLLLSWNTTNAQTNNNHHISDSAYQANSHSSIKATIYSAIFPGLGQIYNKKYWKIPIIYGGFATLWFLSQYNHKKYIFYQDAYAYADLPGPYTMYDGRYKNSREQLLRYKQYFKRNRDMMFIIMAGLYVLNVVDALVDAHMFYFDVSDDLSLNIKPEFYTVQSYTSRIHNGFGLSAALHF